MVWKLALISFQKLRDPTGRIPFVGKVFEQFCKLDLDRQNRVVNQEGIEPVSARRNHVWEGETHPRNGDGVKLQHHPWNPNANDDPRQFPRLNTAAEGDLGPLQHEHDKGQHPEHAVAQGEYVSARSRRQALQGGIEERFEVPHIRFGQIGRDARIELNLH